jgi:hypothetical protein
MTMSLTVNQLLAEVQSLNYEERRRFVQLIRQLYPLGNVVEKDKEELLND